MNQAERRRGIDFVKHYHLCNIKIGVPETVKMAIYRESDISIFIANQEVCLNDIVVHEIGRSAFS